MNPKKRTYLVTRYAYYFEGRTGKWVRYSYTCDNSGEWKP